jgi:hypothetical protein
VTATIIELRPKRRIPRRWIVEELWDELLGMTSRLSEMAHRFSFRDRERRELTNAALLRFLEASKVFEAALEDYREELLKNLDAYCPRAAKRIRESKPRHRSPASRRAYEVCHGRTRRRRVRTAALNAIP